MSVNKCGDCVYFFDCFNVSSNLVGKLPTPTEISQCENIKACVKFKRKDREANPLKERS